jgi:hypothetical protein
LHKPLTGAAQAAEAEAADRQAPEAMERPEERVSTALAVAAEERHSMALAPRVLVGMAVTVNALRSRLTEVWAGPGGATALIGRSAR